MNKKQKNCQWVCLILIAAGIANYFIPENYPHNLASLIFMTVFIGLIGCILLRLFKDNEKKRK